MRGAGQLLEREDVLAAIGGLLDGVRAGRGGALFVVGEAGLGKTACLSHAMASARPSMLVGLGRGDAMEASLPFGVLGAALDAVGNHDLLRVPAAGAGLGDVRAARFYGVLRWLAGTSGPMLLALDDLHWADPDSLALLSFLCRRLDGLPVAILGTLRPWPAAAYELTAALIHDGHAGVQRLAPLSEDAATVLLTAHLGGAVTGAVSRAAAGLCAGNPLLLEQVAASLRQRGPAGALIGDGGALSAEGIVLTRFAGLPPAALRVAQAASVLGTRFRPVVATRVAGLDEAQAEVALEALCRSGLVHAETATTAGFVHPLLSQSLYHDMAAPVRARLHARAFTVLCEQGLETEAVEHAIRADLIGDQAAIGVVERAGRAALATGAAGIAVDRLRAAVRLAGDRAGLAVLLALGEALVLSGRPAEAIEVYEQLLAQTDLDRIDRVQALRLLGRALFLTAAHDQAVQRFATAAALAEACGETTVAEVLLGEAIMFWATLGPAHALPLATRAHELTATAAEPLRRQAMGTWGLVTLLAGDPAGQTACDLAAADLPADLAEPPYTRWGMGPLSTFAVAALATERFAEAERALTVVLAAAGRSGAVDVTAIHLTLRAMIATRRGRLADAVLMADQVSTYAELIPASEAYAGFAHAEALLLMGRLAECADWCQRAEAIATPWQQSYALLRLWHVRAQLLHHAGDLSGACALYVQIEQLTTRMGIGEPCAVPWARHALVTYLAGNRAEDAHRVLGWLERSAARLPCRWPRIAAATGQAQLAESDGDLESAERRYQAALVLHDQVELPIEHVETLLGYGRFLRRHGQPVRARPHLAAALVLAEKCEATWLADQACAELVIAGGRRRRARQVPTRLTAQEQRVARLAAAGHSNKVIAGQLCLSTKTIEYHLAQIYHKLGITSRRQLMTGHYDI